MPIHVKYERSTFYFLSILLSLPFMDNTWPTPIFSSHRTSLKYTMYIFFLCLISIQLFKLYVYINYMLSLYVLVIYVLLQKKVSLRSGIQRVTFNNPTAPLFLFNFNHVRTGSYNYKRSMGYISRMRYINSSSKAMIIQPREKELNKK